MRKETKRASGIEEGRKLGNSEGVIAGVPWAPKRSRDHIQRRRAVGKVSAYVGRACENKGRVPRVSECAPYIRARARAQRMMGSNGQRDASKIAGLQPIRS